MHREVVSSILARFPRSCDFDKDTFHQFSCSICGKNALSHPSADKTPKSNALLTTPSLCISSEYAQISYTIAFQSLSPVCLQFLLNHHMHQFLANLVITQFNSMYCCCNSTSQNRLLIFSQTSCDNSNTFSHFSTASPALRNS